MIKLRVQLPHASVESYLYSYRASVVGHGPKIAMVGEISAQLPDIPLADGLVSSGMNSMKLVLTTGIRAVIAQVGMYGIVHRDTCRRKKSFVK